MSEIVLHKDKISVKKNEAKRNKKNAWPRVKKDLRRLGEDNLDPDFEVIKLPGIQRSIHASFFFS